MKELEDIIVGIIKNYSTCYIDVNTVFSDTDITSVDTILIFIDTEKILGIEIPDVDVEFLSVKSYINYISNLLESSKNKHKLN